jgi:hypothetical protein
MEQSKKMVYSHTHTHAHTHMRAARASHKTRTEPSEAIAARVASYADQRLVEGAPAEAVATKVAPTPRHRAAQTLE